MSDEFDVDELRKQLIEYYGTALFNGNPVAMFDLDEVNYMNDEEILEEARRLRFI